MFKEFVELMSLHERHVSVLILIDQKMVQKKELEESTTGGFFFLHNDSKDDDVYSVFDSENVIFLWSWM